MNEPTLLEMPLVRVTAYEDRADLVREATVKLRSETETFLVGELSPLLSEDRVVVTAVRGETEAEGKGEPEDAGGLRVDDVRIGHRWIGDGRVDTARLKEVREKIRAAEDELAAAAENVTRLLARREKFEKMAARYAAEVGRAVAAGTGTAAAEAGSSAWDDGFDALEKALGSGDGELAEARARVADASREVKRLQDLIAAGRPREMRYVSEARLTLAGGPGPAKITLRSVVPCALWRPAHEAHLLEDGNVAWTLYATVWQKTGEDWRDVELTLSTARPSAGALLPSLAPDLLRLREKTKEERRTIRVEHRHEEVPRADLAGAAPGVYDGGAPRELRPEARVTLAGDGRPHRVAVGSFVCDAHFEKVAMPELSRHVFDRATLRNQAGAPLLAGPVTLLKWGNWAGVGDLPYVGEGEEFDLSFGSDDRILLTHRRRRLEEERKLAQDRVHFLTEVDLSSTGAQEEDVTVLLRLPKSELDQLRVAPSPQHCQPWPVDSDEHGLVRTLVRLRPGELQTVRLGFHFETSGNVVVPDPW